jgi:hypothetical protein
MKPGITLYKTHVWTDYDAVSVDLREIPRNAERPSDLV